MQIAIGNTRFSFDPTYAALALTTLLWSSNFVIGRAIRDDVSPSALNFLRWALALLVLVPFTWRDLRAHRAMLLRHWKLMALLGLTGIAAFQTLVYLALTRTSALNTMQLLSLSPLLVAVLSWATLGDRITRMQGAGLFASLAGASILVLHGDVNVIVEMRFNAGDLVMLVAVLLWAVYSVLLRRRPAEIPALAVHTASALFGTLWMLPMFAWQAARESGLPTTMKAWIGIAFVAVFSSALAHGLWVRSVAAIGANRANVFVHLMPMFGAVLAIVFLSRQFRKYEHVYVCQI
jgi:drug/metabolite transporter (DMT)-like permease